MAPTWTGAKRAKRVWGGASGTQATKLPWLTYLGVS
jgi:hypothetical protein